MTVTKPKVRGWMVHNAKDYRVAGSPWEINMTALAEAAAHQFDHDEWLDDETHWVWDAAFEASQRAEKELA
jgi:hypothetical protein